MRNGKRVRYMGSLKQYARHTMGRKSLAGMDSIRSANHHL